MVDNGVRLPSTILRYPGKAPIIRKLIGNFFCFVVPGVTLLLVMLFTVSPRAGSVAEAWIDNQERTVANIQSCSLVRDGFRGKHAIRCEARYEYHGQPYQADVDVWSSSSPFATPASLQRELQYQSAFSTRDIAFSPRYPAHAKAMDDRMLAVPSLGALLIVLLCAVFGLAFYMAPRSTVHRREDYVLDRATDELVPINDNRARRMRQQSLLWSVALSFAMLVCVYGLSGRLQTSLSMLAFSQFESQPAQLTGCEHRRYGGRKGYDQIDCQFRYEFEGQVLTGQAESLAFRSFPTRKRLDARVAQLEGMATVAYVDPVHPGYAMAPIDTRWFVPHTFGLFELLLLVLLAGVLPVAWGVVLWRSRSKAD